MSERWARLTRSLADAGIPAEVSERAYPGGISRFIAIRHNDLLIEVHDKQWRKNDAVWIGWQVHTEGAHDSIVRRVWPCTKKRGSVVSAVTEALAAQTCIGDNT